MPIVIGSQIKLAGTFTKLEKLQKVLDSIEDSVDRITGKFGGMVRAANSPSQGSQVASKVQQAISAGMRKTYGSRQLGSSVPKSPKPPKFDPFSQDPAGGMRYFQGGAASGIPYASRQYLKYRNQSNAINRAQSLASGGQQSPQQILTQALMRTRFAQGMFGGLKGMPLGVDIMKLLQSGQGGALSSIMGGSGAMGGLGAVAAPAMAAAAAVAALAAAAIGAKAKLEDITQSYVAGGGTPGQARAASVIGQALGLGPGGLAGIARNLPNGLGPIAAAKAGVNPYGSPFTNNDYNANGLKLYDYIAKRFSGSQAGFAKARQFSEMAGAPDLAKIALMSPQLQAMLRNTTERSGSFQNMQAVQEFEGSMAVVKDSLSDIVMAVGTPVLKSAASVFQSLSKAVEKVDWGKVANASPAIIAINLFGRAMDGLSSIFDVIEGWLNRLRHMLPDFVQKALWGPDDKAAKAIDRNTSATEDNTRAVRQGTYGGGPRAQGAVPKGLQPAMVPNYSSVPYGVI